MKFFDRQPSEMQSQESLMCDAIDRESRLCNNREINFMLYRMMNYDGQSGQEPPESDCSFVARQAEMFNL